MVMPNAIFYIAVGLGAYSFFVRRRALDIFTIAFASSVLYFSTIFAGDAVGLGSIYPTKALHPPVVLTAAYVLLVITIFAYVAELQQAGKRGTKIGLPPLADRLTVVFALLCAGVLGTYMLGRVPDVAATKADYRAYIGREFLFFLSLSTIGIVGAFGCTRSIVLRVCALVLGLVSLALVTRHVIATAILAAVLVVGYRRPDLSLIRDKAHYALFGVICIAGVAVMKPLYGLHMTGKYYNIFTLTSVSSLWKGIAQGFEPLRQQYMFNEVVSEGYSLPITEFIAAPMYLLPFPLSVFDSHSGQFNMAVQRDLFPDIGYGLAYNPWAEAYSYMGALGLLIVPLGYGLTLYGMDRLIRRTAGVLHIVMVIVGIYWSFWFHRNGVPVTLAYLRNTLWPVLGLMIISMLSIVAIDPVKISKRTLGRRTNMGGRGCDA